MRKHIICRVEPVFLKVLITFLCWCRQRKKYCINKICIFTFEPTTSSHTKKLSNYSKFHYYSASKKTLNLETSLFGLIIIYAICRAESNNFWLERYLIIDCDCCLWKGEWVVTWLRGWRLGELFEWYILDYEFYNTNIFKLKLQFQYSTLMIDCCLINANNNSHSSLSYFYPSYSLLQILLLFINPFNRIASQI